MNIFKAMKPEKVYESLVLIPWGELADDGITTALLDFDNTLGPDHATEPENYSFRCVKMIEDQGIRCCLVSNAKSDRSELMKSKPENCVMVGDQVFTDVIAGNRAGVRTFMVERLHKPEIWYVMLKRPFEKLVRLIGRF